jgi:hypothetical protein
MPRTKLDVEALSVETFEAGTGAAAGAVPTLFTGIDSTCPCCGETPFTCQ